MKSSQNEQVELVAKLQLQWLKHMKEMLDSKAITSTDMATLARVLMHSGWTLDPKQLPQGLQDKLTTRIDPKHFDEDDPDVLPLVARG